MKVLWLITNTLFDHFKIRRAFEKIIGRQNIVFYGNPLTRGLSKTHDKQGFPFFPQKWGIADSKLPNGVADIVKEEEPDIIMAEGFYRMENVKIPRVKTITDYHGEYLQNKEWIAKGNIDMILTRSWGDGMAFRIREMGCNVGYFPLSASIVRFYDKRLERTHDVHLAGCINIAYPIRLRVLHHIQDKYTAKRKGRVPFSFTVDGINYICDRKRFNVVHFANIINKSKLTIFGTGIIRYALCKFFEVMACNTLVMSNFPVDWKALRFEDGKNIVEIDSNNFPDKIKYYLENDSERKKIARNGMELFLKYHTHEQRAKQLIAQFKELINAKNEERPFNFENVKGEAGRMLSIVKETEEDFNKTNLLSGISKAKQRKKHWGNWITSSLMLYEKVKQKKLSIEEWERIVRILAE